MMRSPEQQFATAKGLPIAELAKVLQGQSDVVDMSIAEMVLRQKVQAQKAQQGMAAQAMANSPKVVEKDLAQASQLTYPMAMQQAAQLAAQQAPQQAPTPRTEAGIGNLPAPNMEAMPQFAGGGIVAFDRGGRVPTEAEVKAAYERWIASKPGMFMPTPKGDVRIKAAEDEYTRLLQAFQSGTPLGDLPPIQPSLSGVTAGPANAPTTNAPAVLAQTTPATAKPAPAPEDVGIASINKQLAALRGKQEKPTLEKADAEVEDIYKRAGVSTDPYADYKKALAEEKAQSAADRTQAGWSRLLEAGLGIMGGTSPYGLTNIGQGALPAAKGAMEDVKEFNKLDRERNKALANVAAAENELKRGITDKKVARYDAALKDFNDREFEISKLGVTVDLKKMELAATKGDKRMANALEAAQRDWKNLPETDKLSGKFNEDTFIRDRAAQYLVFLQKGSFDQGTNVSVPSGVKVTREK